MCYDEHYVLYQTDESQACTPQTNNTLHINLKKERIRKDNHF